MVRNEQILNNISIRLATRKDSNAIIDVQYEAIKVLAAKDYTPQELNALLQSKSNPRAWDETILVAEIDREIVGFASLIMRDRAIGAVYVKPNFARQGIGTKLLLAIEENAIAYRINYLGVCSSLTGHAFYVSNDYKTLGKTYIPINTVFIPCIAMEKKLTSSIDKKSIFETRPEQFDESIYQFFVAILGFIFLISLIL